MVLLRILILIYRQQSTTEDISVSFGNRKNTYSLVDCNNPLLLTSISRLNKLVTEIVPQR